MKRRVAEILLENNFIRSVDYIEDDIQGILRIRLKYTPEGKSIIKGIKRISKPGLRDYRGNKDILKGSRKPGMIVLSTSSGIMTEKDAVKCRHFAGAQHWYLPIEARLPNLFGERLLHKLKGIQKNGSKTT